MLIIEFILIQILKSILLDVLMYNIIVWRSRPLIRRLGQTSFYDEYSFIETLVGTCFFLKLLHEIAQDLEYESLKEERVAAIANF